jgi:hypothetical protein
MVALALITLAEVEGLVIKTIIQLLPETPIQLELVALILAPQILILSALLL